MAVAVDSGFYIAKLFGVKEALLISAKGGGFQMEHSGGTLFVKDAAGQMLGTVPLKGTAITLAKNGQMGSSSKAAIQYQIEKAIEKGLWTGAVAASVMDVTEPDTAEPPKKKPFSLLKPPSKQYPDHLKSAADKAAWTKKQQKLLLKPGSALGGPVSPELPGHDPSVDAVAVLSLDPVDMGSANTLYQPVNGTSNKYYLLAFLHGDVKLAGRVWNHGQKASFRCEGKLLKEYEPALSTVGFDFKNGYASVHLDCSSPGVRKTYGAILGAIGFSNLKEVGDINVLPGTT